jgi:hypothetical protein
VILLVSQPHLLPLVLLPLVLLPLVLLLFAAFGAAGFFAAGAFFDLVLSLFVAFFAAFFAMNMLLFTEKITYAIKKHIAVFMSSCEVLCRALLKSP